MDYLTAPDLPFAFQEDSDLVFTDNDNAIKNNIILCVFLRKRNFMLALSIGSELPMCVFDPNDDVTKELVSSSVREAVAYGEPRIKLDPNVIYVVDEVDGTISKVYFNYVYLNSNAGWKSAQSERYLVE